MRNIFFTFRFDVRIFVALVFYSFGISKATAQEEEREYVPFVEEGKVWYCAHAHYNDEHFSRRPEDPEGRGIDCIFTMYGDTLINGMTYKKVYCQYEEYYTDKEQHYYCAVREEAYQVFIIEEDATNEKLIYDFSRPKEFITMTYNGYQFVRTNGERFNDFSITGQLGYFVCKFTENGEVDYSNNSSYWMDGVGDAGNNPFAFEFTFLSAPLGNYKFGKRIHTITCMKDGKYIYNLAWMVEPSGSSIDDRNLIDNPPKSSISYDLQGRRIDKALMHSIYIVNGKKYIVK